MSGAGQQGAAEQGQSYCQTVKKKQLLQSLPRQHPLLKEAHSDHGEERSCNLVEPSRNLEPCRNRKLHSFLLSNLIYSCFSPSFLLSLHVSRPFTPAPWQRRRRGGRGRPGADAAPRQRGTTTPKLVSRARTVLSACCSTHTSRYTHTHAHQQVHARTPAGTHTHTRRYTHAHQQVHTRTPAGTHTHQQVHTRA